VRREFKSDRWHWAKFQEADDNIMWRMRHGKGRPFWDMVVVNAAVACAVYGMLSCIFQ